MIVPIYAAIAVGVGESGRLNVVEIYIYWIL